MGTELLKLTEAAREIDPPLSDARLRQLAEAGRFPAVKYGTVWLVSRRDFDAWRRKYRRMHPPKRAA